MLCIKWRKVMQKNRSKSIGFLISETVVYMTLPVLKSAVTTLSVQE
jgi:hypothetical protein